MTAWWYWLAFALVAVAVLAGPPISAWLEDRADARDRELWARMPGATR